MKMGISTRGFWLLLGLVVVAGCQQQNSQVLERLPDPPWTHREAGPAPAQPPLARPSVPAIPRGENWLPPSGISERWKCIVIHHSASALGSLRDIDRWHRAKGWDGCGYHFVIGNGTRTPDGQVEPGYRWRDQSTGAHCRLSSSLRLGQQNYYNEHGVGIVLVGDFEKKRPSARQIDSLLRLVRFLQQACNIPESRVHVHGDLKSTACPGGLFPEKQFRQQLSAAP